MPPDLPGNSSNPFDLVVAGGGAAGFFGALSCAETFPGARIVLLERTSAVLGKVKISGGGRCNVTHACFDPLELSTFYPRGARQLIGPFHRWGAADTMAWFEDRGVPLKVEPDGRVFPQSDDSQTIIDCLTREAHAAGIEVRTGTAVEAARLDESRGFHVHLRDTEPILGRQLLVTLGGTRNPAGAEMATALGHTVEPPAPSLFTFRITDARLDGLQGLSVPRARVRIAGVRGLEAEGPILVTHWGLSGPAILRVSAWGARVLQACDYRFEAIVNWCGDVEETGLLSHFERLRVDSPRRTILNDPQFEIPARLWKRLVEAAEASPALTWPHLDRSTAKKLACQLTDCRFAVDGKSTNKDEFVTCGGVSLDEVSFKTMESRIVKGLYFAGEVLDIDGITGGFNFQSAWTTGRIAGSAIGETLAAEAKA